MNLPDPITMKLEGSWFRPAYYVYIVVMKHQDKGTFLYFGMTGDRKHTTARSPFYRMSGHFNKGEKSTENQIIKGLKDKFHLGEDVAALGRLLQNLEICYYAYPLADFATTIGEEQHTIYRQFAEQVESWLILHFKENKAYHIFNNKISMKPVLEKVERVGEAILKDLQSKLGDDSK